MSIQLTIIILVDCSERSSEGFCAKFRQMKLFDIWNGVIDERDIARAVLYHISST